MFGAKSGSGDMIGSLYRTILYTGIKVIVLVMYNYSK